MRQELLEPVKGNTRYAAARTLLLRICKLLKAGKDFSEPLAELNQVAQKSLSAAVIEDDLELIPPKTYAYEVIADLIPMPTDLSYAEMLEVMEQLVAGAAKDAIQDGHWFRCLEANTGDKSISSVLLREVYSRSDPLQRPAAKEILDRALAAGGRARASLEEPSAE